MHATPGGPELCSALSEALSEPLPGTAAVARTWLCLEQRGPWGGDAVLQSHLDPAVGKALTERAAAGGVRLQLIRRPGRHPDTRPVAPRRVYLAHTEPDRSWLRAVEVDDAAQLLDLDFAGLADGRHDGWGQHVSEPLLLVCTNGRRDRCCALRGRALVAELGARHGDSIWETTHTGGHRFAPAAVLLPSGYTYGRLDGRTADAVLSAALSGKVVLDQCRGRSAWSRAGQAAELAVREAAGEYVVDALRVDGENGADGENGGDGGQAIDGGQGDEVRVAHRDGREWRVTVRVRELDPPRPNGCGKAAGRLTSFVAEDVRPWPGVIGPSRRRPS